LGVWQVGAMAALVSTVVMAVRVRRPPEGMLYQNRWNSDRHLSQ